MVMVNKKEPEPFRRLDLHFVWLGLPIAIVIGAGAWLGVPSVIIPMALLVIALAGVVSYVYVMIPISRTLQTVIALIVCIGFSGIAWSFWDVFTVDAQIRKLTGSADPRGGEAVLFAVQLTNRGKPTSLKKWSAQLIDSGGNVYKGEPLEMNTETIEMMGTDQIKVSYVLPDCDLQFETARALQTGDSAYGIIAVRFPGYKAADIPLDATAILTAIDMLGRKITTGRTLLRDINGPRDVFPCRHSIIKHSSQ